MKKQRFKISGMHCTACAMNIDGELEDTDGIKASNTNYSGQHTDVEYDPDKTSETKIVSIIKSVGYDAQIT